MCLLCNFSLVGLERPAFDRRKSLDPFSAIALGVGAVTGIGSLFSGNHANSENRKLTREQMAWQSSEAQSQRSWQQTMWERQNQWNTPLNQKRLYEAAGFNPALAYGAPATAGSVGSGAFAGSASPVPQQPLDFEPLSRVANVAAQTDLLRSQAKNVDQDTLYKVKSMASQLNSLEANIQKMKAEKSFLEKQGKNVDALTADIEFMNNLHNEVRQEMANKFRLDNQESQIRMKEANARMADMVFRQKLDSMALSERKRMDDAQIASWQSQTRLAYDQLALARQNSWYDNNEKAARTTYTALMGYAQKLKNQFSEIDLERAKKAAKWISDHGFSEGLTETDVLGQFLDGILPLKGLVNSMK